MGHPTLGETNKAKKRRLESGFFDKYLQGKGIDIGCGPDPVLPDSDKWDQHFGDPDANFMEGVEDEKYDYVYSSHCLEHLALPGEALCHWVRILKPGGFLSVLIPHRDLYEQRTTLPSKYNLDHKNYFVPELHEEPCTLGVRQLIEESLSAGSFEFEIVYIKTCDAGYHESQNRPDGHAPFHAEYSIEFVVKKL